MPGRRRAADHIERQHALSRILQIDRSRRGDRVRGVAADVCLIRAAVECQAADGQRANRAEVAARDLAAGVDRHAAANGARPTQRSRAVDGHGTRRIGRTGHEQHPGGDGRRAGVGVHAREGDGSSDRFRQSGRASEDRADRTALQIERRRASQHARRPGDVADGQSDSVDGVAESGDVQRPAGDVDAARVRQHVTRSQR